MPQRLVAETANLVERCQSDEDVRETAIQALRTAAEHGFNHGNREFVQSLCDELSTRAAAETDATRKQRLLSAVDVVFAVAIELRTGSISL